MRARNLIRRSYSSVTHAELSTFLSRKHTFSANRMNSVWESFLFTPLSTVLGLITIEKSNSFCLHEGSRESTKFTLTLSQLCYAGKTEYLFKSKARIT